MLDALARLESALARELLDVQPLYARDVATLSTTIATISPRDLQAIAMAGQTVSGAMRTMPELDVVVTLAEALRDWPEPRARPVVYRDPYLVDVELAQSSDAIVAMDALYRLTFAHCAPSALTDGDVRPADTTWRRLVLPLVEQAIADGIAFENVERLRDYVGRRLRGAHVEPWRRPGRFSGQTSFPTPEDLLVRTRLVLQKKYRRQWPQLAWLAADLFVSESTLRRAIQQHFGRTTSFAAFLSIAYSDL